MGEQSDTPRTEMAEGQGLNPYFEGRFDGESDELCALRLTLARERDEARAEVERLRKATEERDEWRLASEPPEDGRRVLIWVATESGGETFRPAYCPVGGWTSVFDGETLVAWRDVTPPGSDNIHNIRPLYAHPPRDEWRLASEPPEDDRSVLVWMPGKLGGLAIGRCSRGNWSPYYLGSPVTHWRDVTPPTEGA